MDTGTLGLISLPCHVRKQKCMAGTVGTHDQTAARHWFLDSSSHQAFPIVGTEKHTGHEAEIGYVLVATNGKSPKKNFPVCTSQNTSLVSRPWILPIIDPATDSNCTCHGLSDANGSAHYFINCVPHLIIEALFMSHTPMSFTSELQDHVTPICFMMVAGQGMW